MKSTITKFTAFVKALFILTAGVLINSTLIYSTYCQPLQLGQSVVTSFDGTDPLYKAVKVIDLRNRPPYVSGGNFWNPNSYSGADWTHERMGNVFGVTFDDANPPNIYVARSTVYCGDPTSLPGLIYKIDGATWAVSDFVVKANSPGPPAMNVNQIPNMGSGLGNLCYDKRYKQFFVTNHEDGMIYRIKEVAGNGVVMNVYDPFADDAPTAGFVARGERIWGIGVFGVSMVETKVYFGRWKSDRGNISGGANEIWSVTLDNTGEFIPGSERLEITLPLYSSNYSNPVSDIEFSNTGKMLVAERTMKGDMGVCVAAGDWAHQSRILEYQRSQTGLYNNSIYGIKKIGISAATNSSGGVDYEYGFTDSLSSINTNCDSVIVGTGDYLFSRPGYGMVYGLQFSEGYQAGTANYMNYSHFVDINGVYGTQDKTTPGDVDVYRKDSACTCTVTGDLYIKDSQADIGNEPNLQTGNVMWASEDIWICDNVSSCSAPGVMPHYNLPNSGNHNYVNVRVRNNSSSSSCGGVLTLQWAKASTALPWPKPWDNTVATASGMPMGGTIGVYNIPGIPANGSAILSFQWDPPNPNSYFADGPYSKGHFCLLGRIETAPTYPYGMTFPEINGDLYSNVKNNNNIAWKNVEIISEYPDHNNPPMKFFTGSLFGPPKVRKFVFADVNEGAAFVDANVTVKLNPPLYNSWTSGGKLGFLISEQSDSSIKIHGNGAYINNILIDSNSIQDMQIRFIKNSPSDSDYLSQYNIDISQYDEALNKIEGGNRFCYDLNPTKLHGEIKLFIQGRYLGSGFQRPDTVRTYLRNSSPPYSIVDSVKANCDTLGNLYLQFNNSNLPGSYYVVVKNRHMLETWSSSTVSFIGGSFSYDFTTSLSKAYQNNMVLSLGAPCIFNGDVNQSGNVNLADVLLVTNDATSFTTGSYLITDFNASGTVNLADILIVSNNNTNFVVVKKP